MKEGDWEARAGAYSIPVLGALFPENFGDRLPFVLLIFKRLQV